MAGTGDFRSALQAAVDTYQQADHPLVDKWARGEVKRETIAGAIAEHWHWLTKLVGPFNFSVCAKAPPDVVELVMENYAEEVDPKNPHVKLIERFAAACGVTLDQLKNGRGLPSTDALSSWQLSVAHEQPWIAAVAAAPIASEAQEPKLFSKVLQALREVYKFSEHDLEYWWLHAEVDIEHGGRAFETLVRHCDTQDKRDTALYWAKEGARRKYFFWDGINLAYEIGYRFH